jgi:hypothetical protein
MNEVFDDVDVARLRRRHTVKWTLYGPAVLAAWGAEMDFDVAGGAGGSLHSERGRGLRLSRATSRRRPTRMLRRRRRARRQRDRADVFVPRCAGRRPTPAYPPFFEVVALTGRRSSPRSRRGGERP